MNLVIGYLLKSVLTKIVGYFLFVAFQIKEDSDFNPKYFKKGYWLHGESDQSHIHSSEK